MVNPIKYPFVSIEPTIDLKGVKYSIVTKDSCFSMDLTMKQLKNLIDDQQEELKTCYGLVKTLKRIRSK